MPLVIPDRPVRRTRVGERISVDGRASPEPGYVAADLMRVGLPAPRRQRPPLKLAKVSIEQRRAALIEASCLLDLLISAVFQLRELLRPPVIPGCHLRRETRQAAP